MEHPGPPRSAPVNAQGWGGATVSSSVQLQGWVAVSEDVTFVPTAPNTCVLALRGPWTRSRCPAYGTHELQVPTPAIFRICTIYNSLSEGNLMQGSRSFPKRLGTKATFTGN
jgi:hypothetical protein